MWSLFLRKVNGFDLHLVISLEGSPSVCEYPKSHPSLQIRPHEESLQTSPVPAEDEERARVQSLHLGVCCQSIQLQTQLPSAKGRKMIRSSVLADQTADGQGSSYSLCSNWRLPPHYSPPPLLFGRLNMPPSHRAVSSQEKMLGALFSLHL